MDKIGTRPWLLSGYSSDFGRCDTRSISTITFRFRQPFRRVGDVETKQNPDRQRKPPRQNLVGPRVAALRRARGLSQDALAARCARLGWDISENGVTKIETQVRCVTDAELFKLARALRVKLVELVPAAWRQLF